MHSPSRSPFRTYRSAGSRRRSNSSDFYVPSLDSSIPTESVSDTKSSLDDSDGQERSRCDSPDVILVGNAEDDGSKEEETISLTGFSKSDTEGSAQP